MGHKKNTHYPELESYLSEFADEFGFRLVRYSQYHMRLFGDFTILDVWTTGKYYVLQTDYYQMGPGIVERGSEKGFTPTKKEQFYNFLHKLYFPVDYL